jgi:hypothetical protein
MPVLDEMRQQVPADRSGPTGQKNLHRIRSLHETHAKATMARLPE